ncbi:MAG: PD40 domain-containing protein, partial [Bacteroidales bacterium]|nr:PD40 domain-containing protein [Bacteroidales bacterium]
MASINFNIFRKILFVILIFIFSGLGSFAQDKSEGEQKVEDEAFTLFTNKEYDKAMPLFSQLLSLYPQDPSYNYGYGVCLIETNTDTKGAMKYLKFAQSKSQNPVIYYYLGKSYHLNYQFDKAISNYQQFKGKAPKPDLAEFAVDQKIRMAQNGKELINYVSDLIVLDNKKIKDENFFYSYRLDDFGGKLVVTPKDFKTKVDIKKKYRGITFIWNDSVAFFASYGGNKKGSLDIYEVKKNPDKTWSPAQNIGPDINTGYDENFPYLSPDGKTFYFSSKGFNSMGGYDIFKTKFDSVTARFSKPENMDFPINSPFDDLLYVTDLENRFAYFASKRETNNEEVSVYRIQVDRNRHEKPVQNIDEVIEKAKLNITPLANRPSVDETETTDVGTQVVAQNKINEELSFPELQPKSSDPNAEVKQAVEDDLQRITENVEQTKDVRDIALVEAYDKSQQANGLRGKANKILKGLDQVPDEQEQAFLKKEAQDMLSDATKLSQEAVTAYNLNKHLEETVQYKEQDVATAKNFIKKIMPDANSDSLVNAYNKTRKQFNQNQDKYVTVEKEVKQRNQLMASNLGEIKKNQSRLNDLNSKIKSLNDDLTVTENQLANASNQDKSALEEKYRKQVKELNKLISEKNILTNKTNYLIAQNDGLQNEVKYLRSFKSKTSDTEIGEVHQKMIEIDKTALLKNISETENNLEMDLAQQVAEKTKAETEPLLAENTVSSQNKNQQVNNTENVAENHTENTNTNTNNPQTNTKSANEQMADSLQTIIAQKKEQINQTTDVTEKQNLQNEVNDLSQILNTIRPQENNNVVKNQVAENKEATLESRFPDMKIKSDDDASTKYEKTLFKEQYLIQEVKEQEANLENLKTIR